MRPDPHLKCSIGPPRRAAADVHHPFGPICYGVKVHSFGARGLGRDDRLGAAAGGGRELSLSELRPGRGPEQKKSNFWSWTHCSDLSRFSSTTSWIATKMAPTPSRKRARGSREKPRDPPYLETVSIIHVALNSEIWARFVSIAPSRPNSAHALSASPAAEFRK